MLLEELLKEEQQMIFIVLKRALNAYEAKVSQGIGSRRRLIVSYKIAEASGNKVLKS